ncbi:2-polyprenyl-3-methyl-6-methoxy-1,4-benzoquinone monooxygenase [Paucibacter sp. PLA-PC-4]|uniref:2-polyprenyl-3-methyl-6-methoxy-1,4-benzoquinone monooxygenase n=1 Tax=Paucibacter sp. PLA-PC-4 TaxID=2993655 RepID=UPI0022498D4C|nr:2-polyprenyl-3-methyl-6-methoxy-1,4-benzoquinone monooxygenase [Paucibacter sp. PLA-PC-4]MCX2861399.1 2-polyprenyl-3-methyl-6-methoxy-1,4-benzoquinone monooxygenase [Paucibacter sp. PLA-PC-4]
MNAQPRLDAKDRLIASLDNGLRALFGAYTAGRSTPKAATEPIAMSEAERRQSAALMRVNHVGEVCAQALYQSQALVCRNEQLRAHFHEAAAEEIDHLAWTRDRLQDLNSHASYLNPLWYSGAFALGALAGLAGDRVSLGFVVETERQVEQHLAGHLQRLPASDATSRAIVEQMKLDEARHAEEALAAGASELPAPVRRLMRLAAKVMTVTAHRI